MYALEWFTKTSTAEFAIRHFILKDPNLSMQQMLEWSKNQNHHVRRLSSEGCRSRLPWGIRLNQMVKDPSPILPILENLKADEELYVRKSVANNLNDISKDHPQLALKIAQKWMGKNERTDWIVRHALRTLLKKGSTEALAMFGMKPQSNCVMTPVQLSAKNIYVGDDLKFSFQITNTSAKPEKTRIEYGITYVKENGRTSTKMFFIGEKEVEPGEHHYTKKQSFKELTTRKHYKGIHQLIIYINGMPGDSCDFYLEDGAPSFQLRLK